MPDFTENVRFVRCISLFSGMEDCFPIARGILSYRVPIGMRTWCQNIACCSLSFILQCNFSICRRIQSATWHIAHCTHAYIRTCKYALLLVLCECTARTHEAYSCWKSFLQQVFWVFSAYGCLIYRFSSRVINNHVSLKHEKQITHCYYTLQMYYIHLQSYIILNIRATIFLILKYLFFWIWRYKTINSI